MIVQLLIEKLWRSKKNYINASKQFTLVYQYFDITVIRMVINMHFESQTYVGFPLKLANNYTPNFSDIYTQLLVSFCKNYHNHSKTLATSLVINKVYIDLKLTTGL